MTRAIRKSELEGKRYWNADGIPMFEEPRPTPEIIINPPEINLTPTINVEMPTINVPELNMQPVADAITKSHQSIIESIAQISAPQITVEPQPAPDMTPVADAMLLMAEAIQAKPDHSEAIKDLLQKIADRATTATWSFDITRDNNGNIASVQAHKE